MSPDEFAQACRRIVADQRGHAAHRSLDILTNDVLRQLGYGAGIDIFEAAVAHWHASLHPYPYPSPCPDCLSSASPQPDPLLSDAPALHESPPRRPMGS